MAGGISTDNISRLTLGAVIGWLRSIQHKTQIEAQQKIIKNSEARAKNMDYTKITDIEFDGINHTDAPDYCDAFIKSASYDGKDMTEEQLQLINYDAEFVHEKLIEYLN